MSEENLEADNPFDQAKLQDSLKFESNFWKEEPTPSSSKNPFDQGSAYDNVADTNYSQMNDNAYDDTTNHTDEHKPNAITSLFNNLKSKMTDDENNKQKLIDNDDSAYDTQSNGNKPPPSSSKKIDDAPTMLNSTQTALTHDELDQKEKYLERREKQLLERKKRLDAVRHELNSTNIRRDNWPCSYYPITFHSIQQEIPPHARSHMKRMYTLVLMTFLCFVLNTLAELILYFTDVGSETDILLAILYLFCGVCGAWRLWYRQIYYGIRDRKNLKMWVFFFFFGAHIGFCIVMTLGIKSWGGAGIIIMIDAFSDGKSTFGGFVCLICACLWGVTALGSVFYLKRSWILHKQRGGGGIEQAKGEFTVAVAQHAAEQLV